jgi:hypothetical protein
MSSRKKTYWVLAIDGGGIRGLFASMILTKIQAMMGNPLHRQFDLFVGTSIGGLISLCLAQAHRCEPKHTLISLFSQRNVKRVFDISFWDKAFPIQPKPKYDGKGKRKVISEHLYVETLGELCGKTAVVTYNIEKEETRVFRSWTEEDAKVNIISVGDATSAAPVYFPAVKVEKQWYIDGGISANNPSLIGFREAIKLWGKDADIRILSVGTGKERVHKIGEEAEDWGLPEWLYYGGLIDIAMDAPRDVMWKCCQDILPNGRFLRINGEVRSESMDDTSMEFRTCLEQCACKVFEENKDTIRQFLEKKCKRSPVLPIRSLVQSTPDREDSNSKKDVPKPQPSHCLIL